MLSFFRVTLSALTVSSLPLAPKFTVELSKVNCASFEVPFLTERVASSFKVKLWFDRSKLLFTSAVPLSMVTLVSLMLLALKEPSIFKLLFKVFGSASV